MTELIEKYFDLEKIREIAKNKNYDEISLGEYIRFLDQTLKVDGKDGVDEELKASILRYSDQYMSAFVWERKKGFSLVWAKEFAFRCIQEEEDHAPAYAFREVRDVNPEQALTELKYYAELTNRDELFIKHFAFLIDVDVPCPIPSVEEQSIRYSKIYKQQIEKGKTNIFANHYADDMATGKYTEQRCYAVAEKYEMEYKLSNRED